MFCLWDARRALRHGRSAHTTGLRCRLLSALHRRGQGTYQISLRDDAYEVIHIIHDGNVMVPALRKERHEVHRMLCRARHLNRV